MKAVITKTKEYNYTEPTFNELPAMMLDVYRRVESIYQLVSRNEREKSTQDALPDLMDIDGAAEFLRLKKATVYKLVSNRNIPYMKKGKRLYFSRRNLTTWLESSLR